MTAPRDGYRVRRFRPEDAPGVGEVVRHVYENTYVHAELYHPDELIAMNEDGRLVSFVAEHEESGVVGHYALERPDLGPVAETGEAMVVPEHRGQHLLDRMHELLIAEAQRLELLGLYGQAVTVHVFSQKTEEKGGGIPVGLTLGLGLRTTHLRPEPLPQRYSAVLYFRYLQRPAVTIVYAPPQHRGVLARLYEVLGVPVEFRSGQPAQGPGRMEASYRPTRKAGAIRVFQVGADSGAAIAAARRQLCADNGAEVVFLELPLTDPGTPELCRQAEANGFFFTGIGPHFAGGDTLRMQYLNVDLNLALLQIASPIARELLDYIAEQRRRTTGK